MPLYFILLLKYFFFLFFFPNDSIENKIKSNKLNQKMKCFTLFVTHYPLLAKLQEEFPSIVGNYHMSFITSDDPEGWFSL